MDLEQPHLARVKRQLERLHQNEQSDRLSVEQLRELKQTLEHALQQWSDSLRTPPSR